MYRSLVAGLVIVALIGGTSLAAETTTTKATVKKKSTTSKKSVTTKKAKVTSKSAASATKTVKKQEKKSMSETAENLADMKTTKGTITIRFLPGVAPNHVKNFIELSQSGYYNGTRFHRVIPGFMIQGGDPNTKKDDARMWGTGGSGKNVKAEFNATHHARGIVSMARSGDPDSASSQFFICVAEAGFLDRNYTAFGEVVTGMEVVDAIVSAKTNGERPVEPVAIESITIRPAVK
ncbi:MAG TPA: peptidylprolyl isomerase [Thermoanaerobaculia bacterium]|nr:peptidylprolyl isomerase [Thermoanaerobaculia bacterium]